MKLFLVHCGFYDLEVGDGLYESHVNFFVAAESPEEARRLAKQRPEAKLKRMHVDGLQEIRAVGGHRVRLEPDAALEKPDELVVIRHRDLAPPSQAPATAIV